MPFGFRPLRLRTLLLAYIVIPLTLLSGALGYYGLRELEQLAEERMQEEIQLVARSLQIPLGRALSSGTSDQVRDSLESAFALERVYGAYVYDNQGQTVLALGREPGPSQSEIQSIANQGVQRGEYGRTAGRRVYSYFVPLGEPGGLVTGVLQVTRRRQDFDDYFAQLRNRALVGLALSVGLMACLVYWGHHHALGKHLTALIGDMKRVTAGSRAHRTYVQGPQEVYIVAKTLNGMLDSIEHSELKLREQHREKNALEKRLEKSRRFATIGSLAAGIAHELGTPLSIVDGQAQRLQRQQTLSQKTSTALNQIREEVRRMERIVRDLLDFGSTRATRAIWLNLGEVVGQAMEAQAEFARSQKVSLIQHVEDPDAQIRAAPGQVERVVSDVLRNGIQATPGGQVRVRVWSQEGESHVWIDDDGPGIPDELHSQIFEPFFTTKPPGEGSGLGLALAYQAIQNLQGSIEIAKSDLGGARFDLSFCTKHSGPRENG